MREVHFLEPTTQLVSRIEGELVSDPSHDHRSLENPSVPTSLSLLSRVRANDAQAWQRLSDLYGPLVYHWCRKSGFQAADAADVVQEVFCSVANGISDFQKERPSDTFRGWLWTITRNKVRDRFRGHASQAEAVGGTDAQLRLEELPDPWSDSADDADREIGSLFGRALGFVRAEFENRTWEAFWRTTVDGQTTADVATELGVSKDAVRQAKSRVLRRLRDELGDPADSL
jgi:RNA polymerase sigma-70 factor, ECF subfamily